MLSHRATVGLDAARAFAACYVVLHHVANAHGWSHGAGAVFRFGQEAVLIFFLLSGFVIFANEQERALRPRGYYLRRLRRIYPVLLIAMAISTLVALDNGDLAARFHPRELVATLASLQDIAFLKPGVIADPYLGNDPLWSLSYEVAFYLVFPPVLRLWRERPRAANTAIGAGCCLAYASYLAVPNHFSLVAAYYLVWWCGAMTAEAYGRGARDARGLAGPLLWLAALCVVAGVGVGVVGYRGPGFYPALPLRHFAVALLMLLACFGPLGRAVASRALPVARPVGALASISYGLYAFHFPLLIDWHRAQTPVGAAVAAVVLVLLAWLAERQLIRVLPRAPSS